MDKLKSKLKDLHGNGVAGVAIIFGDSSGIKKEIYSGTIHRSSQQKVDLDTRFDIQSITKVMLTVPLVLNLIREQKIKLSSLVAEFLPTFDTAEKKQINILDLLNHTSGLSDESVDLHFSDAGTAWAHMLKVRPTIEAGRVEYADLNYRILGRVIEAVSMKELSELARDHFETINITSRFGKFEEPARCNIAGASKNWGQVDDDQDILLGGCVGCDGVFSSARDLSTFCLSLLADTHAKKLIRANRAELQLQRRHASFYDSLAFGEKALGWEINKIPHRYGYFSPDHFLVEKAGGGGAFISIDLDNSEYFIFLTNHGRPNPFDSEGWNKLISLLDPINICRTAIVLP